MRWNSTFKLNLTLKVKVDHPHKTKGTFTKVFCICAPNLVILAWTGEELSCGQTRDWHTDRPTHTQTQATIIPKSLNWPRVKTEFWPFLACRSKNGQKSHSGIFIQHPFKSISNELEKRLSCESLGNFLLHIPDCWPILANSGLKRTPKYGPWEVHIIHTSKSISSELEIQLHVHHMKFWQNRWKTDFWPKFGPIQGKKKSTKIWFLGDHIIHSSRSSSGELKKKNSCKSNGNLLQNGWQTNSLT